LKLEEFRFKKVFAKQQQIVTNKFNCVCSYDVVKLKIPVRNKNCTHLEAFELTTIFRKMKQAEKNVDLLYEGCPVI
jgi:hypothetical protein